MAAGFHLIGIVGLSAGLEAGSAKFRALAAPSRMLVTFGGILITVSAVLFAFNMLRTLSASPRTEHSKEIL